MPSVTSPMTARPPTTPPTIAPTGVLLPVDAGELVGGEVVADDAADDVVEVKALAGTRGSESRMAWPEKSFSSQLKRVKIRFGVAVVDQR